MFHSFPQGKYFFNFVFSFICMIYKWGTDFIGGNFLRRGIFIGGNFLGSKFLGDIFLIPNFKASLEEVIVMHSEKIKNTWKRIFSELAGWHLAVSLQINFFTDSFRGF